MRTLVAIPVYNEAGHLRHVFERVRPFAPNLLFIDDGSTDHTSAILSTLPGIDIIRHRRNQGYGRSIRDAFRFASSAKFDWVITLDCDDQHEPEQLPEFLAAASSNAADIISGSRYLSSVRASTWVPPERRRINHILTGEINERLGLNLTDSFCGYKAHRVSAIDRLRLSESGYGFPMQLWVQAAAARLSIAELPTALIYNDPKRSFGAVLDNPDTRLAHYRHILYREIRRVAQHLPAAATDGIPAAPSFFTSLAARMHPGKGAVSSSTICGSVSDNGSVTCPCP
jgi:dolichol-phosphate mannosyltransferase